MHTYNNWFFFSFPHIISIGTEIFFLNFDFSFGFLRYDPLMLFLRLIWLESAVYDVLGALLDNAVSPLSYVVI